MAAPDQDGLGREPKGCRPLVSARLQEFLTSPSRGSRKTSSRLHRSERLLVATRPKRLRLPLQECRAQVCFTVLDLQHRPPLAIVPGGVFPRVLRFPLLERCVFLFCLRFLQFSGPAVLRPALGRACEVGNGCSDPRPKLPRQRSLRCIMRSLS